MVSVIEQHAVLNEIIKHEHLPDSRGGGGEPPG